MKVTASLNYYRRSPKKVALSAQLFRGLKTDEAIRKLNFLGNKDADIFIKLIQSAVSNAENNFSLDKDNLYISEIKISKGPTMKRWRPRAYGRATEILRRTSHITIVLDEFEEGKKAAEKGKPEIRRAQAKNENEDVKSKEAQNAGAVDKKERKGLPEESNLERKEFRDEAGSVKSGKTGWTRKVFRRKSG